MTDIDKERDEKFLRKLMRLCDEWAADTTAQMFGTPFETWLAARASTTPPAAEPPVGYFELPVRSGSVYREVDPKYKGDPDVAPLYRAAPAVQAVGEQILPTNDEVYAEVCRDRGKSNFYVSTNAVNDVMQAVRKLVAPTIQPPPSAEPAPADDSPYGFDKMHPTCNCRACNPHMVGRLMFLCATCGNKRCPHATDHALACTNSNEPGQPGSSYGPPIIAKEQK